MAVGAAGYVACNRGDWRTQEATQNSLVNKAYPRLVFLVAGLVYDVHWSTFFTENIALPGNDSLCYL